MRNKVVLAVILGLVFLSLAAVEHDTAMINQQDQIQRAMRDKSQRMDLSNLGFLSQTVKPVSRMFEFMVPQNSGREPIDIKFNGQDQTIITQGDDLVATIIFSDDCFMGNVTFWLDMNGNGTWQPDVDIMVDEWTIIDNSIYDEDPTVGVYQSSDFEGLNFIGGIGLLGVAQDNGGQDIAFCQIEYLMSDYSISGTVTPATANIVIFAENDDGLWIALTDDNGNYQCYVSSPGLYNIGAFDFLSVLSGYFSNTFYSNVNVNGHITGYDFVFVQGNSFIEGVVTNQSGAPLEGLLVRAEYDGPEVYATTDENGFYSLTVIEGFWEVGFISSQLIPDFMSPEEEEIFIDDGETITVDFMLYETDSSISGTIYLDDVPYPGFEVGAQNDLIGYTETISGVNGLYELSVSSAANSVNGYNLWINIWDIPGVYVVEFYNNVMSGSTGLDFHIYTASGGVQGYIYDSVSLQPISYAGISGFDNNNYYHTGSDDTGYYELFLPPGTYEIMANANMYYPQNQLNVVVGDDFITIDFYLDPVVFEGVLEGHVYESGTTNPIAGAELMVSNNIFWANTTSDDTGYYYFDMPNGTFNLNAWHNNYYGSFIQGITISNNTVVQNVEMDPITFDGALEGYVYEVDSNTPIPFAHIEVFGIYSSSVMSDANGFYHIDLPNGGYSAICWKNGYFEDNLDWFEINNFTIINDFYLIPMSSSENLLTPEIVSLKNYPNPFYNSGSSRDNGTELSFYLPFNSSQSSLEIYNLRGQLVITLTEGPLSQGSYSISWNGSDRFHKKVSAGVYLYKLTIDDNQFMRKMLLIK